MIPTILAFLVIASAPIHWYLALRLWRLHRVAPDVESIRERGIVATALALVVTAFAAVFLNNGMEFPILNLDQTQLLGRGAILALAGPPLYWLFLYRNRTP